MPGHGLRQGRPLQPQDHGIRRLLRRPQQGARVLPCQAPRHPHDGRRGHRGGHEHQDPTPQPPRGDQGGDPVPPGQGLQAPARLPHGGPGRRLPVRRRHGQGEGQGQPRHLGSQAHRDPGASLRLDHGEPHRERGERRQGGPHQDRLHQRLHHGQGRDRDTAPAWRLRRGGGGLPLCLHGMRDLPVLQLPRDQGRATGPGPR